MLPIVHHPAYHANIPEGHRFPMGKFRRLMEILRHDHLAREDMIFTPAAASDRLLCLAHNQTYVDQVLNQQVPEQLIREIGFPVNASVARRAGCATGGTILAARLALEYGIAANSAGGSHHAKESQGNGFCVFNDVAVAIRSLQAEGLIKTALVIDLDVHQGDGTAHIFEGDDDVFTLSIHAEKNYPVKKAVSNLDIALGDGTGDDVYLGKLHEVIPRLFVRAKPDIVFYNAGVDPHVEDRLGRLALSDKGIKSRDLYVINTVRTVDIPLAIVIGGGYMDDIDALAQRHSIVFQAASQFLNCGP